MTVRDDLASESVRLRYLPPGLMKPGLASDFRDRLTASYAAFAAGEGGIRLGPALPVASPLITRTHHGLGEST